MLKDQANLAFLKIICSAFLFLAVSIFVYTILGKEFGYYFQTLCSHVYGGLSKLFLTTIASPRIFVFSLLVVLLSLGLVKSLLEIYRQYRLTKNLVKVKDKKIKVFLWGSKKVLVLPTRNLAAFCFGFLRPQIYISQELTKKLKPLELEAVLLHEEFHQINYDNLKILLVRFFARSFFLLPLFSELAHFYEKTKEIAADEYALEKIGNPKILAQALYVTLVNPNPYGQVLVGGIGVTNERIDRLLGKKVVSKSRIRPYLLSFLILVIILAAFSYLPKISIASETMVMPQVPILTNVLGDQKSSCSLSCLQKNPAVSASSCQAKSTT